MTDDQIKHMAEQFLNWKLPADFNPDDGINFDPLASKGTQYEYRREPTGTNLFSYTQAELMVRHMIEGLPERTADAHMASLPTSDALTDEPVHADQITAPGRYMAPVDALGEAVEALRTRLNLEVAAGIHPFAVPLLKIAEDAITALENGA